MLALEHTGTMTIYTWFNIYNCSHIVHIVPASKCTNRLFLLYIKTLPTTIPLHKENSEKYKQWYRSYKVWKFSRCVWKNFVIQSHLQCDGMCILSLALLCGVKIELRTTVVDHHNVTTMVTVQWTPQLQIVLKWCHNQLLLTVVVELLHRFFKWM